MYHTIDGDFYHKQTQSPNPLRRWFHRNRYRIANSLIEKKYGKGKKILDLGCGSCDWNISNLPVFGVDVNENLLKTGKSKNRLVDYKIVPAGNTELPSESFDIVTAFEFLEHVEDYEAVIKEATRLLKPGGCFIVSVPYDTLFSFWRPLFFLQVILQGYIRRNSYYKKRCGHINHFSPKKIKQVISKHGHDIETLFNMRRMTIFLCARKTA